MKEILATLLLVVQDGKILLAQKKRGWRMGIYNGVGGKVEQGEDIEAAMIRETMEEVGIIPTKYEKVALSEFIVHFKGELSKLVCHKYLATEFDGTPTESDEMRPEWFKFEDIPYDNMWKDDIYWLPRVLAGEKLKCFFTFDEDNIIISQKIETATGL